MTRAEYGARLRAFWRRYLLACGLGILAAAAVFFGMVLALFQGKVPDWIFLVCVGVPVLAYIVLMLWYHRKLARRLDLICPSCAAFLTDIGVKAREAFALGKCFKCGAPVISDEPAHSGHPVVNGLPAATEAGDRFGKPPFSDGH